MGAAYIRNDTRSTEVATECDLADTFWLRLRGLLGRPPLRTGEGLLITPCRAVHMMGMKYPLDVVFLDRDARVVGLETALAPGAKSAWYARARHALELPVGSIARTGTEIGDSFAIEPVAGRPTRIHAPELREGQNRYPGAA